MSTTPRRRDRRIARDLHGAALRLLRRLRQSDEALGLSTARLSALSVLVFAGSQSVSGLARLEQVSQPTMTHLVGALVRDGLARSRPAKDDGRVRIVEVTAKGRKTLEVGRRRRVERLAVMMAGLHDREKRTLDEAAALIRGLLEP